MGIKVVNGKLHMKSTQSAAAQIILQEYTIEEGVRVYRTVATLDVISGDLCTVGERSEYVSGAI